VSFAAIILCVDSQRVFILVVVVVVVVVDFYLIMTQPGNFWIHFPCFLQQHEMKRA
jgi:hypothetical protein